MEHEGFMKGHLGVDWQQWIGVGKNEGRTIYVHYNGTFTVAIKHVWVSGVFQTFGEAAEVK